ncbi:hypothetical protein H0O02_01995 [Candidatus Micrarchaeota archaeon]|nr:hypothetical protein [Candidatus Micrarchaeota archaeon]
MPIHRTKGGGGRLRDAPREPLAETSPRRAEMAKTPEWILKRWPNAPKELPKDAVDDFYSCLEKAKGLMEKYRKNAFDMESVSDRFDFLRVERYVKRAARAKRDALEVLEEGVIFADYMNNFSYAIFGRVQTYTKKDMKEKFGNMRNAGGYEASDLLKNQTRKEFYQTVRKVIEECRLSYEKAEELHEKKAANKYLFPAFLRLMEMGYKRYPDLVS